MSFGIKVQYILMKEFGYKPDAPYLRILRENHFSSLFLEESVEIYKGNITIYCLTHTFTVRALFSGGRLDVK